MREKTTSVTALKGINAGGMDISNVAPPNDNQHHLLPNRRYVDTQDKKF